MQRSAGLPVLVALALASPAHAGDDADDAGDAKALFERGRELVKAGNNAEACPLFAQSLARAPALGTKLNLAICWAATGRLVDAERLFQALVDETREANQPQREELARAGLEQLEGRVPHVRIDASALAADARIELDGHPLADASQPIAIDPGHHAIHAAGAQPVELDVAEGKLAAVKLEPLALRARPRQIWIARGIAGGALLVSAIAGLAVLNERGSALHHCATVDGTLACDQRGLDLLDRAHAVAHVSTGFLVIGAGAAALAAVLEVKWRRSNDAPVATAWSGPHAAGVALEGRW